MDRLLLASSSPRRRELLSGLGLVFDVLAPDVDESLRDVLPPPERVLALAEDKARAAEALIGGGDHRWILAADTLVCLPGAAEGTRAAGLASGAAGIGASAPDAAVSARGQEGGAADRAGPDARAGRDAGMGGAAPAVGREGGLLSELVLGKPRDREDARAMIKSLSGRVHLVHTGLALLDRLQGRLELVRSDSSVRFAPMSASEIEEYLDSGEWEGVAGAYRVQGLAAKHIERIEGSWSGIVGLPIRELYVILRRAGFDLRP